MRTHTHMRTDKHTGSILIERGIVSRSNLKFILCAKESAINPAIRMSLSLRSSCSNILLSATNSANAIAPMIHTKCKKVTVFFCQVPSQVMRVLHSNNLSSDRFAKRLSFAIIIP